MQKISTATKQKGRM